MPLINPSVVLLSRSTYWTAVRIGALELIALIVAIYVTPLCYYLRLYRRIGIH